MNGEMSQDVPITEFSQNPNPLLFNSLNSNYHCFNNITITDPWSAVLAWLSPLEPRSRHSSLQERRIDGVGGWLLRTEQFQTWHTLDGKSEPQKATLFCCGNPGVGKTYICSLAIDALCDKAGAAGGENIAVVCFYFNFAAQKEQQSATNVFSALLQQVVRGFDQIPETIIKAFQKCKSAIGGRRLLLSEIVKLLGTLSSLRPIFFCLDALDECPTEYRAKILLSLKEIISIAPTRTRVFLTGRQNVRAEVERHLPGAAVVSISPRRDDILQFILSKLEEGDPTPDEMDERLKADILGILDPFSEMVLLVDLNLDEILQETTIRGRRKRLGAIADGLGLRGAYDAMLARITAQCVQKSGLGVAALMWLCHSERPLGAEELCFALAVEIGSVDYNAENVPSIQTVLSCCQGLVVKDEQGSTLRLSHFTLQEYLTSHPSFFRSPHATIAETCLTYLNWRRVVDLSAFGFQFTQYPAFLEYSALHWGTHMKKEPSARGTALALELFSQYERHISARLLLEHTLGQNFLDSIPDFSRFGGLHCASMFGVIEVVRALMEIDDVDINRVDDTGATPLLWAAKNGHGEVVELFLRQLGINPDSPDYYGQTPILHAAENGHQAVVNLLLGREDVNYNTSDIWGQTVFSYASTWIASQFNTT